MVQTEEEEKKETTNSKIDAEQAVKKNEIGNLPEELFSEWTSLEKEDLIRGQKPKDIEQRCLELCATYIGGSWSNANNAKTDLTIKRIAGGLTNQLYHVHLNDNVPKVKQNETYGDKEPTDVAIKLYMGKHIKNYLQNDYERLNDTIILTITSQLQLSPKVYGIFSDGFIQGYYEHEQFRVQHHNDPEMVKKMVQLLARIANLEVPISKQSNKLFDEIESYIDIAYNVCHIDEIAKELNLEHLQNNSLRNEYEQMSKLLKSSNIPVVFVHNDFRGSNLLVIEEKYEKQILVCDFEYCGYGSRGYDLASIILEWGRKSLMDFNPEVVEDAIICEVLKYYIEECDRLKEGYSKQPGNSLEDHLKEVKICILYNMLFFLLMMAKQTESIIPAIPFDVKKNTHFVEFTFKYYLDYKKKLIEEGTIKFL